MVTACLAVSTVSYFIVLVRIGFVVNFSERKSLRQDLLKNCITSRQDLV